MEEFIEVIKITDIKAREIENFSINPDFSDSERILFVLKKGHISQKISLVNNFKFLLTSIDCVNAFFSYIEDKFLDFEQELQYLIVQTLTSFYLPPVTISIVENISSIHINSLLVLIVKIVVNDEKNEVSICLTINYIVEKCFIYKFVQCFSRLL
jgi:hypothetical protein